MSATQYYFIPSVRQGLATHINGPVSDDAHRVKLAAELEVVKYPIGADSEPELIARPVQIYGPGDVLTFDPRIVSRTYPEADVGDFEPNYFPAIEFSDADFLWRFSATRADDTLANDAPDEQKIGRLMPWLTLVVLVAEPLGDDVRAEFEETKSTDSNLPPYIKVKLPNAATSTEPFPLPDLDQAWHWAHVQITDEAGLDDNALENILKNQPERAISRLLCPRRLQPKVKYVAFVVPTFRLGVRAGLGLELPFDVGALVPAWKPDGSDRDGDYFTTEDGADYIRLPYYYRWEFRTGNRGDFEHLVRLLEARKLTGLGIRDIDCKEPGFNIEALIRDGEEEPENHYLALEGALQSLDIKYSCWGRDSCIDIDETDEFTDIDVRQLNSRSIEVRWHTSEAVTSRIDYGEDETYGNQVDDSAFVEQHVLNITGLIVGTRYHFKISGEDAAGNLVETLDGKLQIPPTHFQEELANLINTPAADRADTSLNIRETDAIQNISIRRQASGSAVEISFYTPAASTAYIDYGETNTYGESVTETAGDFANEHRLSFDNPVPGDTYHFRITAEAEDGTLVETEDGYFVIRQFMIDETDVINGISVKVEQSSDEAVVSWHTTLAAKSRVDFWQDAQAPTTKEAADLLFRNEHSLTLENLLPGNIYFFKIVAEDEDGNINETLPGVFFVPNLPVVVPPVYGHWHASQSMVDADNQQPWFAHLNLDPRHRMAAGLGAEVIRKQQEALMSSAWDQLGAIDSVNDLLRRAQLGRESTSVMHRRIQYLDNDSFLQATASVQKRVLIEDTASGKNVTAKHYIATQTRIPNAALDPAFRRIGRARGPVRKRQGERPNRDLLSKLAGGQLVPAGKADTLQPVGTLGICDISKNIIDKKAASIEFTAIPIWVNDEPFAELVWNAENVTSCSASGSSLWAGDKPHSGTETIGPLGPRETLVLECIVEGVSSSHSVTIVTAPAISLITSTHLSQGPRTIIKWRSVKSTSCTAQLGWDGVQEPEGLHHVFPSPEAPIEYGLHCEGEGGVAEQTVAGAPMVDIWSRHDGLTDSQITLQWDSAYTESCTALEDWIGDRPPSGIEALGHANVIRTYELRCNGVNQTGITSTTVTVSPSLVLSVNIIGDNVALNWGSENATSCSAEGAWTHGSRSLAGTFMLVDGIPSPPKTYWLECSGATGSARQWVVLSRSLPNQVPLINLRVSTFGTSLQHYALVEWDCINTDSCSASFDSDFEEKPNSGVELVGPLATPLDRLLRFAIVCEGPDGDRTFAQVDAIIAPRIKLLPGPEWTTVSQIDDGIVLNWEAEGAIDSVVATGDWSGQKTMQGTEEVGPITGPTTYVLKATGAGGSSMTCFTVNTSPTLYLAASSYISNGATYATLTWESKHASSCEVTGAWSGNRSGTGSEVVGPIISSSVFKLSCDAPGGSASREIIIDPLPVSSVVPINGTDTIEAAFCEDNISEQGAQDQLANNPFDGVDANLIPNTDDMVTAVGEVIENWLNKPDEEETEPPVRDIAFLDDLRANIYQNLQPGRTLVDRTRQRLHLSESLAQRFEIEAHGDPLDPIMWAPEFPQPMYEPLRDISHELLLPGVEKIPQNTLGILKTNRRFVESYLLGLNHEFASELLWREYPTDQRGSYFRQFWDVSERITGEEVPEDLKDVRQLHRWFRNALGNNTPEGAAIIDSTVLIVRGDLLKRYPGAVIYAIDDVSVDCNGGESVPGLKEYLKCYQRDGDGNILRDGEGKPLIDEAKVEQTLEGVQRIYPIFRVTLPPDLTFFGFPFVPEEARDKFFILEERVGEVRFGMDTPNGDDAFSNWDDLSWDHFGYGVSSDTENYGVYLDVPPDVLLPDTNKAEWNSASAAKRAWITMQKPVRIAVHGSQMLPEV